MPRAIRLRLLPLLVGGSPPAASSRRAARRPPAEAQRKKVPNIAAKEPDSLDPHASTIGLSYSYPELLEVLN